MKQFSSPRILSRSLDQREKYAVSLVLINRVLMKYNLGLKQLPATATAMKRNYLKKTLILEERFSSNDGLCSLMFSAENDNVLGFVMIVMRGISFSDFNKNMNATKSLLYHSVKDDCELTLRLLVLWSNELLLCNFFVFATFLLIRLRTFRKI